MIYGSFQGNFYYTSFCLRLNLEAYPVAFGLSHRVIVSKSAMLSIVN